MDSTCWKSDRLLELCLPVSTLRPYVDRGIVHQINFVADQNDRFSRLVLGHALPDERQPVRGDPVDACIILDGVHDADGGSLADLCGQTLVRLFGG